MQTPWGESKEKEQKTGWFHCPVQDYLLQQFVSVGCAT
jgi:hypothetical protein